MSPPALSHVVLQSLAEAHKWDEILIATADLKEQQQTQSGFWFFRGLAMARVGRLAEAFSIIDYGLSINPQSRWGHALRFETARANKQFKEAFEGYASFINASDDSETEKAWYVQCAAELDLLDLAFEMNQKRQVIRDVPELPKYALALQCFCKADTLEHVLQSMLALESSEQFSLIMLQDSVEGSPKRDRYAKGHQDVKDLISKWLPQLQSKFFSVEVLDNKSNLGTAPTCRRLIDYVTTKYDKFVFIEDDCVLVPSALDWITYHLDKTVSINGPWFATCESSYFDKEHRKLEDATKTRLQAIADLPSVRNAYVLNTFVNSTCFATTAEIWKICANYRSFTRGPESLTRFVKTKGMTTVAPIVPRSSDIGMLHELGYSVANVGAENVQEKKDVYLMFQGIFDPDTCKLYDGDRDLLYRATSRLDENDIQKVEALNCPLSPLRANS